MKRLKPASILFTLVIAMVSVGTCMAEPSSNSALAQMEAADQADRTPGLNKIDCDVVGKRDTARRASVTQLLAAGKILTADDFFNAAVIFQHGESVQDTQLAISFATIAVKMDASNQQAETLMAQAWDRIMVRSGKPQWYGTQHARSKATGKVALSPTDPSAVTDAQRKAMGLPTLAEAVANAARFNK